VSMNMRQNKSHSQVLLVALLAFMPAAASFGKTDQTSPSKAKSAGQNTKSGKRVVEAGEAVVRDSSEYYREGKKGYVAFELFGSNPFPFGSYGVMGGVYLSPDTIIDGSYTTGKFEFLGFKMKSDGLAIRYKMFNGNSFYWRAGGMYRAYEYDTGFEVLSDNTINGKVKVSSFGVDFGIGNQWQWETFTQGFDWIGFYSPLAGTYTVSRPSNATDSWYESERKSAASLSKRGSLQFLRYYLGISF